MKKFYILALAAAFCLALALPASAEVKVTGVMAVDYYYHSQSSERSPSGFDEDDTQFAMWPYTNYLRWTYTNKDATLGGTMQMYVGRRNDSLARAPNTTAATGALWTIDFGNNHFWWKPMPDVMLRFGNQSQFIGMYNGPGIIGGIDATCCMIGGGSLHTSNKIGLTAEIKINDMVSLKLGAYDPDDDDTPALGTIPAVTSTAATFVAADEENTIPRLDIALPVKYQNIQFQPAASWVKRDFDDVAANSDDDYDVWVLALGGQFTYGPLTLKGEIAYGENISDATYVGGVASNARTYADAAGFTRIADSESLLWFLAGTWKINPKLSVTAYYGEADTENDVNPVLADDYDQMQSNYGLEFYYYILPNFTIRPAWQHWDYGDDNVRAGAAPVDNGDEDVVGVGFLIFF
jgi:hypothetical protein